MTPDDPSEARMPDSDPALEVAETVDGRTMEELADYLARGRTPLDPAIEGSAACRLALSNMTRLSELTASGLLRQASRDPGRDDVWIAGLLDTIRAEVVSGRDIPVVHPDAALHLTVTEAAVRGLIRRVGDTTGGIIMGRCSLIGEVGVPGEPVDIEVTCSVEFGVVIPTVLDLLRARIRDAVSRHAELVVGDIDILVDDIHLHGEEPG